MQNIVRTFPSLSAMIEHADGATTMQDGDRRSRCEDESRTVFTGTESWAAAMRLTHRWDDGVAAIERMRVTIKAGDRTPHRMTVKSITPPGALDIAGVIAGDPAAGFYRRQQVMSTRKQRGKVIRVLINTGCSAFVTADTILRRGAAVLALVDMLEARGYRADIMGCAAIQPKDRRTAVMEHRWQVKRPEQKVSLSALAFGLAHTSMHRRVVFSCREVEEYAARQYWGIGTYYGASVDSLIKDEVLRAGGIYLPQMHSGETQFESDDDAREWVSAQIERIMSGR